MQGILKKGEKPYFSAVQEGVELRFQSRAREIQTCLARGRTGLAAREELGKGSKGWSSSCPWMDPCECPGMGGMGFGTPRDGGRCPKGSPVLDVCDFQRQIPIFII